jgi:hypothetical protein
VPSGSAKRTRPKPRVVSRSARLEEKLDGLVSLLRSRQGPIGSGHSERGCGDSENDGSGSEEGTFQTTTLTPASNDVYSDEPSPVEAEESLRRFREEMLVSPPNSVYSGTSHNAVATLITSMQIFSPYLYLPPHMTPLQLRDIYPFLWLNIMSVASKSVQTRKSLGAQVRSVIVQRIVSGSERSLDLLFGTLTFVNWLAQNLHVYCQDFVLTPRQGAAISNRQAFCLPSITNRRCVNLGFGSSNASAREPY